MSTSSHSEASWQRQLSEHFTKGSGRRAIIDILNREEGRPSVSSSVYYSIAVNPCELTIVASEMIEAVLIHPERTFPEADEVLSECAKRVHEEEKLPERLKKTRFRFRLTSMPDFPEFNRKTVPGSEDVGRILAIRGTVIKMGIPKMLETQRLFRCGMCGEVFSVMADYEQYYRTEKPTACPNLRDPDRRCKSYSFEPVTSRNELDAELCRDYQEIKIQEMVGKLSLGSIPRSIWVTLEDDLVDVCRPGDEVTVVGVVKRRWKPINKFEGGRINIDLVIKANYVDVINDHKGKGGKVTDEQKEAFDDFWDEWKWDPFEGRNKIISSFCPQIYGMYAVKLALAVALCGGIERIDEGGETRVRGEPHMLLVGDPGTGKSQLLRYAAKLASRSVLTTGVGSTNAGLTVSAVRDGGEWHLEAGALVLADGGVCCIDEFNSIREADRTCIHEAMEQQSISVAKAGLVCKLQTRCSVLAATNPKGYFYDVDQPLTTNVGIASPLLSRFDLIFVLRDTRNEEWDRTVSGFVLENKIPSEELSKVERDNKRTPAASLWSFEELHAYISFCKGLTPDLSEDSSAVLATYYKRQRMNDDASAARTTVRLLQSCIRIAQGHAKLMRHPEVTVMDAVYAVVLLESSVEGGSWLLRGEQRSSLHSTFPESGADEYERWAELVLGRLGMVATLERERGRLGEERRERDARRGQRREKRKGCAREKGQESDKLMTQVLTKLKSNQFSYASDAALVTGPPEERKKRKAAPEKAAKKKGKRSKKDSDDAGSEDDFVRSDISSSSNSSILDFSLGLEKGSSGGRSSNVVTSTQTSADSPKDKDEEEKGEEKPAKLSERTLSALGEFQASQPIPDEEAVKVTSHSDAEENLPKEGGSDPEGSTTQPKTLQSIFADPNDDFDFEL